MSRAALIAMLGALSIGVPVAAKEGAPHEIVIGASLPLTGPEAKAGARVRDGYEFAFAQAMDRGGVMIGSRRLPVRLKLVDDGTNRQRAADLATELVEKEGVNFLLGSFSTPIIESQSAAAEKLKVPYVTSSGSATSLYQRGFRYLFSVSAPISQLANAVMRWADEEERAGKLKKPLRVALLWENTAHGKDVRIGVSSFVSSTPAHRDSFQLVLDESFELNAKDFTPLLKRVDAANADMLLVDAHLPDYITMQRQYLAMGMCHKIISYGARGPEKEARDALPQGGTDYIVSAVWWDAQMASNALSKAFVEAFTARYHRAPEWYEALAYEAVRALFVAIEKAGSLDRERVRDSLATLKMDSILPTGYLAFPEQYGYQAQYLFVVQQNMPDGSSPLIYPRIAQMQEGIASNPRCSAMSHALK
ncbi:MAG TPA: amino acid ABC transporter substrate-binding protein [Myxococcales bacterium]|nr:amino acid ABC transporter substrate-binding protein [Myxococcales bacterium]